MIYGIDTSFLVATELASHSRHIDARQLLHSLSRAAYNRFAGAALNVEAERPIAVRDGDRLLVGNIDRLVTIYDGDDPIAADILDFKTDAIAPDDKTVVLKKVDYYRPQISTYRGAVCSICRLESAQFSAKLLFVKPDIVEEL